MRDRYLSNRLSVQYKEHSSIMVLESETLGNFTIIQANQNSTTQLSDQEWKIILENKSFVGFSNSRIHFSFLKGLPKNLRWEIWMFLANVDTTQSVEEYVSLYENAVVSNQIEVDIPRTMPNKSMNDRFIGALRRILYASHSLKVEYIQGMNFIIQHLMVFCCQSLQLSDEKLQDPVIQFQILKVFMHIVSTLDPVFGSDQLGIFGIIKRLEEKMCEVTPEIMFLIGKFQLDCMCLFNQNYFTLMLYNNPPESLALSLLDLFFLQGIKAIDTLIIRMIESCSQQILQLKNTYLFQKFLKEEIFVTCGERLDKERKSARSLKDFKLSFYEIQKI